MKKPIHAPACVETLLDSVQDGVMLVGPDGTIRQVNRAMEKITGFAREEMEGFSCTLLGCDACQIVRSEKEDAWCALFQRKRVRNKRCMFTHKGGELIPAVKDATVVCDETGKVIGALEVVHDLSEIEKRDLVIAELNRRLEGTGGFFGMVGDSAAMERVFHLVETAGRTDANILITGESGTGKELVVNALHQVGHRSAGPLVKINCSALTETLIETELFGHVKGAFTGALQHRRGHFESANGGDLFLDEIGDMPLSAQARLLRVVETREVTRVGESLPQPLDVRIIAATNRDLLAMVRKGKFREDLYYRLNGFPIPLPPLRDRGEDISKLAFHLLSDLSRKKGKTVERISPEVLKIFLFHSWPGNIRELRSVLEYAVFMTDSAWVEVRHLPEGYQGLLRETSMREREGAAAEEATGATEKQELLDALDRAGGNQTRAAKLLGVHRMTVFNRMRKYGVSTRLLLDTGDEK